MSTSPEHPLINFLLDHRENRVMLASLRRDLKYPLLPLATSDISQNKVFLMPANHSMKVDWEEQCVHMIASLFAFHPLHIGMGNLGSHLRRYACMVGNDQLIECRFQNLLRAETITLPDLLRQIISILKSKEIPVNWHDLIQGVQLWGSYEGKRLITRRWANEFWKQNMKTVAYHSRNNHLSSENADVNRNPSNSVFQSVESES